MDSLKRVLIVEDNPDAAMLASLLVERTGLARSEVIADGLDALSSCFRNPPDALVLDLDLPSLRGEEILRMVRTSPERRDLPVIVMSSLPEAKRRELELLHLGADAYMDKPLLEATFLQTLTALLERSTPPPDSTPEPIPNLQAPESPRPRSSSSQEFISSLLEQEMSREPDSTPAGDNPPTAAESGSTSSASENIPTETVHESAARKREPPRWPSRKPATKGDFLHDEYSGYKILGVIGSGGMGTVYRAEQVHLHRIVALKILLDNYYESVEMRERFHREALIMARVNHPNIVQVFETGRTEFSSFFSMEYVDGGSLADRIRTSNLNWEECPNIIRQTCNAVAYLHSQGIIHRDIKPSNILLSQQGLVKVTDFGISQARLGADREQFTLVPQFMGTPDYMAPELQRLSEASEKTDLYALGMTFWRMFAGHGARPLGKPLHKIHPEIPHELSDVIAHCIELDPANRFPTVREARDAILEACKGTFSGTWEQYISPII